MSESFRDLILERLKRRRHQVQRFEKFFASYTDVLDRLVLLQAQNDRLSRRDGAAESPNSEGTSKELTELRSQLNELYKKKEQNDQELIDTNNRLKAKERDCAATQVQRCCAFRLDKSERELEAARLQNRRHTERIAALEKTEIHLRDEYLALQATLSCLEEKYKKAQEDNQELVSRWMELKAKEADSINAINEQLTHQRQVSLKADLIEAAKQEVPVFDDKAYDLIDPTIGAIVSADDRVPTRCKLLFEAHESEVNAICWAPSSGRLATGGADRKIKLWELVHGKQELRATLAGSNQAVMSLQFGADDTLLMASCNDFAIRVWTLADQRCRQSLTGHGGKVFAAKFYQQATQVASGSHDRTVKLWDLRNCRCIRTLFAGSTVHDLVTCEGAGWSIVSGHFDKRVRFWDGRTDRTTHELLLPGKITSLDVSADSNYLLACTRDDSLHLMDLRNNQTLHTYSGETFRVGCDYSRAVLSPNMDYCVAGSADGQLFVWNVRSTKIEKILGKGGHEQAVVACSWHPAGNQVASSDRHRTVCLWTEF